MKNARTMTYKELETEVISNRIKMRTASLAEKRELINRSHDLMTEMDRRWQVAEAKGGKR